MYQMHSSRCWGGGGGSVVISCLNLTHSCDICADLTPNPRFTSEGPSKSTKYFMEYFM